MVESNAQRIAKNTGFLFIRTFLVLLVTLYTSRVVIRILGFEDFGLYNAVGSVVVFFSFLQTALNNATYRYLAYELGTGNSENLRRVYSMAINSHILLAICVFVLLEIAGVWFLNNKLNIPPNRIISANWTFQFSLLTFCINIIRTPFNSNIIAHEHMKFYALISIIEVVLKLGIAFVLALSPVDKLISYAALLTAVSIILMLCYVVYCHYSFKDCPYHWYWNGSLLKEFTSYSGWSLLVNVADVTATQCMSIFFFNLLGSVANAALGIANQVIGALNQFLHTFTQAFNPQIIKKYAVGNNDSFMQMIYTSSKVSYLLLLLFAVPFVINIRLILTIWLGKYPEETPVFVQMIIIYSLIDAQQTSLWTAVHATGDIRIHQILMSSIKIMAIPSIWLILHYGGTGGDAIAIWVALNFVCAIIRTLYMHHHIGLNLHYYLRYVVLPIVLVTIVVVPPTYFIWNSCNNEVLAFLLSSILAVLLTLFCGYMIGLNKEERKLVRTMPIVDKILHRM